MGRLTRLLFWLFLSVALLSALLHLALVTRGVQDYLQARLQAELTRRLERQVQIGHVRLSPFLNYLELRQVAIGGSGTDPLFHVESLRFYPDLPRLMRLVIALRTVVLIRPVLDLSQDAPHPPVPLPVATRGPLPLQVDRLQIREGEVTYRVQGRTWNVKGVDADLWLEGGQLMGDLHLAQGTLRFSEEAVAWSDLTALVTVTDRDLIISRLGVQVMGGDLRLTGAVRDLLDGQALALQLTAKLPLPWSALLPGALDLDGRLTGSVHQPAFQGRVSIGGGGVPGLAVEIAADREGVRSQGFQLLDLPGEISGGISLRWADLRYSLQVKGRGVPVDRLLSPLLKDPPLTGTLAGEAIATGHGLTATGLTGQLAFQVWSLVFREQARTGRIEGMVKAEGGRLSLERLRVELPPNQLSTHGLLSDGLDLQVVGRFPRVDLLGALLGAKELGGAGVVTGKVTGVPTAPAFQGAVTWNEARLFGLSFTQIQGEVLLTRRSLSSPRLLLTRGESRAELRTTLTLPERWEGIDGKGEPQMEVEGEVRGAPRDLLSLFLRGNIPVSGRMTLEAKVAGTPTRLEGRGRLLLQQGILLGEPVERGEARIEVQGDRLLFRQIQVKREAQEITGSGSLTFAGQTSFRLASSPLSLEGMRFLAGSGVAGGMRMTLLGEGPVSNPQVRGEVQLSSLRYTSIPLGKGQGNFLFQDGDLSGQLTLPEAGYTLWGVVRASPPYAYNTHVTLREADLTPLLRILDLPFLRGGTGQGSGSGQVVGDLAHKRPFWLSLELNAPRLTFQGEPFQTASPIRLELSGDTFTLSSLSLRGREGWINAHGQIILERQVDFHVEGRVPLLLLRQEIPTLAEATGTGQLELRISGPWAAPRYRGGLTLEGASLRLEGHPERFEGIGGTTKFQSTEIQISNLEGQWAGGRVKVSGGASRKGPGWRWSLDLLLDEADAERVFAKEQGAPGGITGRTGLWGKVTAEGARWEELKGSLGGELKLVLKEGRVRRFTVLANILRILNLTPDPREGVPYDHLKALFHLEGGIAETNDLRFVSGTMKVGGVGRIDLNRMEVDMLLGVQPLRTVDKIINFLQLSKIPILGHLLFGKEQSLLVVSFRVKGPLPDPTVEPVPLESMQRGVLGVFRRILELPAALFPGEK